MDSVTTVTSCHLDPRGKGSTESDLLGNTRRSSSVEESLVFGVHLLTLRGRRHQTNQVAAASPLEPTRFDHKRLLSAPGFRLQSFTHDCASIPMSSYSMSSSPGTIRITTAASYTSFPLPSHVPIKRGHHTLPCACLSFHALHDALPEFASRASAPLAQPRLSTSQESTASHPSSSHPSLRKASTFKNPALILPCLLAPSCLLIDCNACCLLSYRLH